MAEVVGLGLYEVNGGNLTKASGRQGGPAREGKEELGPFDRSPASSRVLRGHRPRNRLTRAECTQPRAGAADTRSMDSQARTCWAVTNEVIGASIEVHRSVGPGLLETAYEECLVRELSLRGLAFERQRAISLEYKGIEIPNAYRVDLLVEKLVVVEVKAVTDLLPVHEAQLLTYLRFLNVDVGLLVNFGAPSIRKGLRRMIRKGAAVDHWSAPPP